MKGTGGTTVVLADLLIDGTGREPLADPVIEIDLTSQRWPEQSDQQPPHYGDRSASGQGEIEIGEAV